MDDPVDPFKRRPSRISIDARDRIWAARRASSASQTRTPGDGGKGPSEEAPQLQEIHLGHGTAIRKKSVAYLKKELEIDYHIVQLATLLARYGSDLSRGLDTATVMKNREKYGKNELTPPKKTPLWLQFLKTLYGGIQFLLWAGSVFSLVSYVSQCLTMSAPPPDNLETGIVLAILVVILGMFLFYQEYSSGKVMESFAKLVPTHATTIRNGGLVNLNANQLVVGDIIEVKFGDRIPADFRIIDSSGFKVDNSSLTGESDPQSRSTICTVDDPMETKNLAFSSTYALEGTARGIVVAVGDNTLIGRIAGLASEMDTLDTPLSREILHFVKLISGFAVISGLVLFGVAMYMGSSLVNGFVFLVGIIAANVPEGVIVSFTSILALAAKRMAKKNCVIRQLHAVETLGSCSVICSDKTGTLTQNKMTASHMWYGNEIVEATLEPEHSNERNQNQNGYKELIRAASLCLRAKFFPGQENLIAQDRKVEGDASESAILRCMEEHNVNGVAKYQASKRKVFEIPFNSSNKWQLSIHDQEDANDPSYLLVMKGAPERIITMCKRILINNQLQDMDNQYRDNFNKVYEEIGGMGERVIGFCECLLPVTKYPPGYSFTDTDLEFLNEDLKFLGLISMVDPPRPGVLESVRLCKLAGIQVVMVTGDHPITAKAIAKKVGIISEGNETIEDVAKRLEIPEEDVAPSSCSAIVLSGSELLEMSTMELDDVLKNHLEIVFARVSPQQKFVIVEGFQRLGKIVAVTGDGVNDSPALKKADIGVAMGIAGSDVSKQAADMILLDDNFSSIVTGVEEGRLIFENLKKCYSYLLAANMAELIPCVAYLVLNIPLPLGTIPMIVICLGTDIAPTISLSYEKAEDDIMLRPPRNPLKEKLVTDRLLSYAYGQIGVIEFFAGMFTYCVIMGENGFIFYDLLGLQSDWENAKINDLSDSYGQQWTYEQRKLLDKMCWTGYFCAVVICQIGNVLASKRTRAPLSKNFFNNPVVFLAIGIELAITCMLTYTPGLNSVVSYVPIKAIWWLPAIPFAVLVIAHHEFRRYLLRNCPTWTWFQSEFSF